MHNARYWGHGLWHQMSEKRLFCFALKGAAILLSEALSKSYNRPATPGRRFSAHCSFQPAALVYKIPRFWSPNRGQLNANGVGRGSGDNSQAEQSSQSLHGCVAVAVLGALLSSYSEDGLKLPTCIL